MIELGRTSSTTNTGLICCPFFVAHGKNMIVCEGLIDGTKLYCNFDNEKLKKWHQYCYCEENYKKCEMYNSIKYWKYPDDE